MKTRFRLTLNDEQMRVLSEHAAMKLDSDAFLAVVMEPTGKEAEEPALILVPESHLERVSSALVTGGGGKRLMPLANDPN